MDKILAVDDNQDILFTIEAIGEVADLHITTTLSGQEGLNILKQKNYNLVIVDYHMPGMNGLDFVKKVRQMNEKIPILVLTVDESVELAQKFLEAGATDFAVKPIRAADLISRINLHLRLNQFDKETKVETFLTEIDLPKGLTTGTLQIITECLGNLDNPETLNQISEKTGLAYQTVHRYLDFLAQESYVDIEMCYGKVGRPMQKYYLKKVNR